jgi:hypothetical protein
MTHSHTDGITKQLKRDGDAAALTFTVSYVPIPIMAMFMARCVRVRAIKKGERKGGGEKGMEKKRDLILQFFTVTTSIAPS